MYTIEQRFGKKILDLAFTKNKRPKMPCPSALSSLHIGSKLSIYVHKVGV